MGLADAAVVRYCYCMVKMVEEGGCGKWSGLVSSVQANNDRHNRVGREDRAIHDSHILH